MAQEHILIIDDDPEVLKTLGNRLEHEGYRVTTADSGALGIERTRRHKPDLIILDIMMPSTDGYEVLKAVRMEKATKEIPVLILTAKLSNMSQVLGFDIGADDYVTKPFDSAVLLARMRRLLDGKRGRTEGELLYRRTNGLGLLTAGLLVADVEHHQVFLDHKEIAVTAQEFRILTYLMERKGKVVRRQELIHEATRNRDSRSRSLDVHINKLRLKLGKKGDFIKTVRGVGYCLKWHTSPPLRTSAKS